MKRIVAFAAVSATLFSLTPNLVRADGADSCLPSDDLPVAAASIQSLSKSINAAMSPFDVELRVKDDSWWTRGRYSFLPGDNYGNMYGLAALVRKNNVDGTHLTFSYSSDLYTAPVAELNQNANGSYTEEQKLTNENLYAVGFDNLGQKKIFYYHVRAGWQVLNSNPNENWLYASTQQSKFHSLTSNVRQVVDIPDGNGVRQGFNLQADAGVQGSRNFAHGTTAEGHADVGVVASGISGASYREGEAEGSLSYKPGWFGVKAALDLDDKFHSGGTEKDQSVNLSLLMGKSLETGLDYERYGGVPLNYVLYNLPNVFNGKMDPTLTLWFRKGI